MDVADRVIWSADLGSYREVELALQSLPRVKRVKIGRVMSEGESLDQMERLAYNHGVKIFDDAKIVEIPDNVHAIAWKHIKQAKPWMLNCMVDVVSTLDTKPGKTQDGLVRFAELCRDHGTIPCGVTVLTSKSDGVAHQQFNKRSALDQVVWSVGVLQQCGFNAVVCSPLELVELQRYYPKMYFVTPAVRLPGSEVGDQVRVDTPGNAVVNGAAWVVSGRDITNSDPLSLGFDRVCANIEAALAAV